MKLSTRLIAGVAAAASLAAFASASQAAQFARVTPSTDTVDNVVWTNTGTGGTGLGGTFDNLTGTSATAYTIRFTSGPLAGVQIPVLFSLTASSTAPAGIDASDTYTQPGIDGDFSFTYEGTTGGGLTHGENLLSGHFTDAWIQGSGDEGNFALSLANSGVVTFTSQYQNFTHVIAGSEGFTLELGLDDAFNHDKGIVTTPGLNPAHPGAGTNSIVSFEANMGGTFTDRLAAVPEPATWGLMLVGFGGMGVVLRNRRRTAAVAA